MNYIDLNPPFALDALDYPDPMKKTLNAHRDIELLSRLDNYESSYVDPFSPYTVSGHMEEEDLPWAGVRPTLASYPVIGNTAEEIMSRMNLILPTLENMDWDIGRGRRAHPPAPYFRTPSPEMSILTSSPAPYMDDQLFAQSAMDHQPTSWWPSFESAVETNELM